MKIRVNLTYYESVRLVIESYLKFFETPTVSKLLLCRIPNTEAIDKINSIKYEIFKEISPLTAERRDEIDQIIEPILNNVEFEEVQSIRRVNELIYFIDIAFIKMICPEYKDYILDY